MTYSVLDDNNICSGAVKKLLWCYPPCSIPARKLRSCFFADSVAWLPGAAAARVANSIAQFLAHNEGIAASQFFVSGCHGNTEMHNVYQVSPPCIVWCASLRSEEVVKCHFYKQVLILVNFCEFKKIANLSTRKKNQ